MATISQGFTVRTLIRAVAFVAISAGKPYVNTYAWFMRMRDGKIVEASAFFDSIEFNEFWARVPPAAR